MVSKNCIYICALLYFNCIAGTVAKDIFSLNVEAYDDTYEDAKSLHISKVETLIHCSMNCLNQARCVSYFYNGLSNMCILHEDPFTYTIRSQSGAGWKFYITFVHSNRCKPDFFYYRYHDLCYKFGPAINANDSSIASICSEPNEDLVRVDSEERQSYIETITADIGLVYNNAICIQGTSMLSSSHQWTFNDGTSMLYSKWAQGQPESNGTFIRMFRSLKYKWYSLVDDNKCSFICEYKYNDDT
ncbi:uncharacterized protein LOC134690348 [Mytilus trossulus]|uniref:uncharacterized protein LOC134690348 n=1 Tax=Mytilus trossulus TaxID=6551 RepID=UPI003004E3F6